MSETPTSARADNSIEPVWRIVAVACEHLRKFGSISHWIGLREILQETMVFTIKYRGFL
jgi:hypothetical protein